MDKLVPPEAENNNNSRRYKNMCIRNIKKSVREIKGYTNPPAEAEIKLNQNENPYPIPDEVKDEILSAVKSLKWGVYPDYNSVELKDAISEYAGVPPEGILVGNGSNEMILSVYLAAVSKGEKILVTSPTFAVYLLLGNIVEGELISVNLTEDLQFDLEALIEAKEKYNPKLTIIPSPNNPTGCILTLEETEKLLTPFSHGLYHGMARTEEKVSDLQGEK